MAALLNNKPLIDL